QLSIVTVPVRDQDRAVAFYTGVLGFERFNDFRYGEDDCERRGGGGAPGGETGRAPGGGGPGGGAGGGNGVALGPDGRGGGRARAGGGGSGRAAGRGRGGRADHAGGGGCRALGWRAAGWHPRDVPLPRPGRELAADGAAAVNARVEGRTRKRQRAP